MVHFFFWNAWSGVSGVKRFQMGASFNNLVWLVSFSLFFVNSFRFLSWLSDIDGCLFSFVLRAFMGVLVVFLSC